MDTKLKASLYITLLIIAAVLLITQSTWLIYDSLFNEYFFKPELFIINFSYGLLLSVGVDVLIYTVIKEKAN